MELSNAEFKIHVFTALQEIEETARRSRKKKSKREFQKYLELSFNKKYDTLKLLECS